MSASESPARGLPQRWAELGLAVLVLAVAGLVIFDSLRVGIDWADDGPRSGYFPFRIGVGLALCGVWLLLKQLWRWRQCQQVFSEWQQLRDVTRVFVPTVVYVALLAPLGLYVPSAGLIAWFMRRHGGYGWLLTLSVSVGVASALYVLFDVWFQLPLPKGPVEQWLGL